MKPLPDHLEYAYLEKDSLLLVIITSNLKADEKKCLVFVLKNHKEAFAWKTSNIPGINSDFCKHKINFKDNAKPIIQRQRRLNPNMKEVVKKEIIKLLDSGIIYSLEDSPWFDIEIINKKGAENVTADHFSCLENPNLEELREDEIDDNFLDEILMKIENHEEEIPWDQPYLFKMCPDRMIRRCVYSSKTQKILDECHHGPTGGHYGPSTTAKKVFNMCPDEMKRRCVHGAETRKILDECHHGPTGGQYGPSTAARKVFDVDFYWPTIFKEAHILVQNCDACQRSGSLFRRDKMPQNNIQIYEVFDVCGIDFMGPFPISHKFEYILVAIDYVSKWAEAEALPTNNARVVIYFLEKLFSRFGILKDLISDRGTHFCNKQMEKVIKRYGVHHRFATAYHPQTSGQVDNTNKALKEYLKK
ncbi:reverse transcriptase domain-containing protein [Tanacetum coccineum]